MIFLMFLASRLDSEQTEPAPTRTIQPVVVAFRDSDSTENCAPLDAQSGACVEFVEFRVPGTPGPSDLSPACAWLATQEPDGSPRKSTLREACDEDTRVTEQWLTAWSSERLLEELVYRWERPVVEAALGKPEERVLGPMGEQWHPSGPTPGGGMVLSVPATERWILPDVGVRWPGAEPVVFTPDVEDSPEMTRFGGRFGDAPYATLQSVPGDIFAARAATPFYEQLCPYRPGFVSAPGAPWSGVQACRTDLHGEQEAVMGARSRLDRFGFVEETRARFEQWALHLGLDLIQFGSVDPTLTHMRTFSALAMMSRPPSSLLRDGRLPSHPNPGSLSEPDPTDVAPAPPVPAMTAVDVDAKKLAEEALRDGSELLSWMPSGDGSPDDFRPSLACAARQHVGEDWPTVELVRSLDLTRMQQWAGTSVRRERLSAVLASAFSNWQRGVDLCSAAVDGAALGPSLSPSPQPDSARRQHLRWALAMSRVGHELALLPPQSSPAQTLERTTKTWISTQEDSQIQPRMVESGPRQVDPLAVCGLREGEAAQQEESIQRIALDVLFVAPDSGAPGGTELNAVDASIWASQHALPFLALDRGQTPTTTRLWSLPDGQAMFRARWLIWSGWHVLWAMPDEASAEPVVAHFAAICGDMVLVRDELVPTVVYAALLSDLRRGTLPVSVSDANDARRFAGQGGRTAPANTSELTDMASVALRSPELADSTVLVLDLAPTRRRVSTRFGRAHTPYLIHSHRVWRRAVNVERRELWRAGARGTDRVLPKGWRRQLRDERGAWWSRQRIVRMSAWLVHLDEEGAPTQVLPERRPGARVSTSAPRPVWRRVPTGAWDLGLSPGPYVERVELSGPGPVWSTDDSGSADGELAPTGGDSPEGSTALGLNNGVGLDASLMRSLWLQEERLALQGQLVLGVRLDQSAWSAPLNTPWGQLAVGVRGGVRVIAPPRLTLTSSIANPLRHPWGVSRPDGSVRSRRMEWTMSAGYSREILMSNVDGGLYPRHLLPIETSLAWSASSRESTSPYLPYRPNVVVGPTLSVAPGFQRCGALALREGASEPICDATVLRVQAGIGVHVGLRALPEPPELR